MEKSYFFMASRALLPLGSCDCSFSLLCLRSGYFAVDNVLLLEPILLPLFMYLYISIPAVIHVVMPWCSG